MNKDIKLIENELLEDELCVVDMLDILMSSDENVWYPKHESFVYKRTMGKSTTNKSDMSQDDKDEIKKLTELGDIAALQVKIKEIGENTNETLKFHFKEEMPSSPISNFSWNETRANLSVQVIYNGYVELPNNKFFIESNKDLSFRFDTHIFRNYTIIKDGVIHTCELPVSLNKETFDILKSNGLLEGEIWESGKIMILNFSKLPIINKQTSERPSAEVLFKKTHELIKLQSINYVFNQYKKRIFDGASKGFIDLYGVEATEWLKNLGLRDYGFNPPSTIEKKNEEIKVNTIEVKIKGLSVPTNKEFNALENKLLSGVDENSLSNKELLIAPSIKEFKIFESTLGGLDDYSKNKMIEDWVYNKSNSFRRAKTKLMNEIAKIKLLIIVGKCWFQEFEDKKDNELTLFLDGKDTICTVVDKQVIIKL